MVREPASRARPRPRWSALAAVAIGGSLGTAVRALAEDAWPAPAGAWPMTTFTINILGAFLLGALTQALARRGPDQGLRQLARLALGTGALGGFTTYSTFAVEIDLVARGGNGALALGYGAGAVASGIAAAAAGIYLVRALDRPRPGGPR